MIEKVISGGQTGIDQMALAAAYACMINTGGTAPKGYLTEAGPDPTLARYGLVEHESAEYPPRTRANVENSEGTLWIGDATSKGARLTITCCIKAKKPYLLTPTVDMFKFWIKEYNIKILNIAGNRQSKLTDKQFIEYRDLLIAYLS